MADGTIVVEGFTAEIQPGTVTLVTVEDRLAAENAASAAAGSASQAATSAALAATAASNAALANDATTSALINDVGTDTHEAIQAMIDAALVGFTPGGGGGSSGLEAIALDTLDDLPAGLTAGTVILRIDGFDGPPPAGDLEVVMASVATQRSQVGGALVIPKPSGIEDGDYLVFVGTGQDNGQTWAATGWTLLHQLNSPPESTNARTTSWLGLPVTDADVLPSSWSFSPTLGQRRIGILFVVKGVNLANPVLDVSTTPGFGTNFATVSGLDTIDDCIVLTEFHGQATSTTVDQFPTTNSDPDADLVVEVESADYPTATRSHLSVYAKVYAEVGAMDSQTVNWAATTSPFGSGIALRGA